MRVAIQGASQSFHHVATQQWFGDDVSIAPADSFSEVFGLINRHEADAAVVAIENSLYGSIRSTILLNRIAILSSAKFTYQFISN